MGSITFVLKPDVLAISAVTFLVRLVYRKGVLGEKGKTIVKDLFIKLHRFDVGQHAALTPPHVA